MLAVSKHLLDAVDGLGALLHERLASTHQVAQISDGLGRNEAGGLSKPCRSNSAIHSAILDVGLVTRHRFHVLGVDQEHLKAPFQAD